MTGFTRPLRATPDEYVSWGRQSPSKANLVLKPAWPDEVGVLSSLEGGVLPFGMGRSYGESCLNAGGAIVDCRGLDRIIELDVDSGRVVCEGGVSFADLLLVIVPRGWFLPVTPGTKFVTVGGAVANDVHGKNHHVAGTFGRHVTRLVVARSDGTHVVCSRERNTALFEATIGGLGLTGVILQAEFSLRRIASSQIAAETRPFASFEEFMQLSEEQDAAGVEYTVAWIDCLSKHSRGLFFSGVHAPSGPLTPHRINGGPRVPFPLPNWVISGPTIGVFNAAYYWGKRFSARSAVSHYDPFFYPLDRIRGWNLAYGRGGLAQYQCVIPFDHSDALREILRVIAARGTGSFLGVLKTFGNQPSPGMLSFPRPGITLALDFPFRGASTLDLFTVLDRIVADAGGALYPAKDSRMPAELFAAAFPRLDEFREQVDPAFTSNFWRRICPERG